MSARIRQTLAWTLGAAVVAVPFALGVTRTADTDAWTHLALGRAIVRHGGLPPAEPLTYATEAPYPFVEWLWQVGLYLSLAALGWAGPALVKAALAAALFAVLWIDAHPEGRWRPASLGDALARAGVLLPALLLVRFRIVERPDLAMMLFLALTIHLLRRYVELGSRWIAILPALQAIWANTHPSLAVSAAPYAAVLGGGLVLAGFRRRWGAEVPPRPTLRQLGVVAGVAAASALASLLNPYGAYVVTSPLSVMSSWWHTAHIIELQRPDPLTVPILYAFIAALGVSLALTLRALPVIPLLTVTPFVVLALSHVRFVYVLGVVGAPVLARQARQIAGRLGPGAVRGAGMALTGASALGIIAAAVLAVAAQQGPFAHPLFPPGAGPWTPHLPEGALRYLDRIGLEGRIFTTFGWGGYVGWRDAPRRRAIIDGRGHAPPELLAAIDFAASAPRLLDELQARFGFDAAVLPVPVFGAPARRAPAAPAAEAWALVYWDDTAWVWLRRSPRWAAVIARDESPAVARLVRGAPAGDGPDAVPLRAVLEETARAMALTGADLARTLHGLAQLQAGDPAGAASTLAQVRAPATEGVGWTARRGLARAYAQAGQAERAVETYRALLQAADAAEVRLELGRLLMARGRAREAADTLEPLRAALPQYADVYPPLMEAYRRLGAPARAEALEPAWRHALAVQRALGHARRAETLRREGALGEAAQELEQAVALVPRDSGLQTALGHAYQRLGRTDAALEAYRRAVELNARQAEAQYRLGMLYRERGDTAAARRHLSAYLELEPRGYNAWQARRALATLPQ